MWHQMPCLQMATEQPRAATCTACPCYCWLLSPMVVTSSFNVETIDGNPTMSLTASIRVCPTDWILLLRHTVHGSPHMDNVWQCDVSHCTGVGQCWSSCSALNPLLSHCFLWEGWVCKLAELSKLAPASEGSADLVNN